MSSKEAVRSWQTHLNPNRERTLHDGVYLFPTDWNLCLSTCKPEPCQSYKEQLVKNISDGCFNSNFIRLGLTRAKALQTASRFPRETRRRFAVPKSNALTLAVILNVVAEGQLYGFHSS